MGPSGMSDGFACMYCMYFNVILTNHRCFYPRPVTLYTSLLNTGISPIIFLQP
jgi:hypothetical protein